MKEPVDAVLALGVALGGDGAPTPELIARADAAARAAADLRDAQGDWPRVVCCGGRAEGRAVSEADALCALLAERGVPESALLREDRSRDTMENCRFAARLLGGAKGARVVVATSDYHMRRALLTARRVGFRARGEAARLPHDGAWHTLRRKELCYTLDLLLGWQDEGRRRPQIALRLFDAVFVPKGARRRAARRGE